MEEVFFVTQKNKNRVSNEGGAFLLPAKEGTCPECATEHDPGQPHNQQSLYWQYHFFGQHGRWPTWKDAMAHCSPEMKKLWTEGLGEHGITVEE